MATANISVSSHTFISNHARTADYSSVANPRSCYAFSTNIDNWDTMTSALQYAECAILRFQRPNALKYSRITSAILHLEAEGLWYDGSSYSTNISNRCQIATYTTDKALSLVNWSNFRDGALGAWSFSGTGSTVSRISSDINITSLYNGDLSAAEFTLAIAVGNTYGDPNQGQNRVLPSSCYLTVTYETAAQPEPTPLYPKDQTLIESSSTLFSWQFNSDTEAVQTAAELQYKNVEDDNYTTVSLTQAEPSYILNQALPAGSYQWRVKVTNDAGTSSNYSSVAYFNIIGKPAAPIINEPANKTLTEITWNTINQQSCEIILADQGGKELYHETLATNETSYRPNFFLNGSYMFSVRVMNNSGMWSDWAQRAFTISATGPAAATLTLVNVAGDNAINFSYSLPEGINGVLMRSVGDNEKVLAHLGGFDTTYRDDTVASGVVYKYYIRTYDEGYTDTAKISAQVAFEGGILTSSTASLNLKTSDEKFLPHAETISRDFSLMKFSGREYPMIERSEFTTIEISRRFHVTASQKKILDELAKQEKLFYRDTKENAFPAAIKQVQYDGFMNDGYLATINLIRLNEEEVVLNV